MTHDDHPFSNETADPAPSLDHLPAHNPDCPHVHETDSGMDVYELPGDGEYDYCLTCPRLSGPVEAADAGEWGGPVGDLHPGVRTTTAAIKRAIGWAEDNTVERGGGDGLDGGYLAWADDSRMTDGASFHAGGGLIIERDRVTSIGIRDADRIGIMTSPHDILSLRAVLEADE